MYDSMKLRPYSRIETCILLLLCISFYRASIYPSVVLGVVILSVCLSVTRVDCDKLNEALRISWYHTKGQ